MAAYDKDQIMRIERQLMTKIKLCGLRRPCDMEYANALKPEYIGFVFAKNSKRYVSPDEAAVLRKQLKKGIVPVGVFVDEEMDVIVELIDRRIIDAVQLHGKEEEDYICALRKRTNCVIIKAFCIQNREDIMTANRSSADYVLLDSGTGSGETFDWSLIQEIEKPYFLAGGLTPQNVKMAISKLTPFGLDASSSLETDGVKDKAKMAAFVMAVRGVKDCVDMTQLEQEDHYE